MGSSAATLPKNHRLILDLVTESGVGAHPTAYDLFAQAKDRQPAIGMATVHRALAQLHEQGLIAKVLIAGMDAATYEPVAAQHAHFRCRRCGTVEDVDYALPRDTLDRLAARAGFSVDEEHVTLAGSCARCTASGA
jgi:Fe2+ or Zn2+ uptake regulation protein